MCGRLYTTGERDWKMLKNNADDWDFVVRGNSWRLILLNHPHSKMCQTQFLRIRSSIEIQDTHSQQKSHFQKIYRPHQNLICSCNHIRRFQEYFNHIHIFIGSTTLQFLQFWYQNGVNILFLVVKPIEVTSGFILKLMKKFARWRRCWNQINPDHSTRLLIIGKLCS